MGSQNQNTASSRALPQGLRGSYLLALQLEAELRRSVGRLGEFAFPPGHYLYFGSALNGLAARVQRHLRQDKRRHWHVDYLTTASRVNRVWWVGDGVRRECDWAQEALRQGAMVVAPGFGASDCRCIAHLVYLDRPEGLARLVRLLMDGLPANVIQGCLPAAEPG